MPNGGLTANEGDWLRREIEHALDTGRNIVPLLSRFKLESDEFRSTLRRAAGEVRGACGHAGRPVS